MSVRNAIALSLALSTLALLAGCGSGSSSPPAQAPPGGSFSASNLNGTYVFSISGLDESEGVPAQIVGTIVANGSGGITGGTIDVLDVASSVATNLSVSGSGTYTVGVDGRGSATISTTTANPFGHPLTFDFVLQNSSHGLITEFDINASGSGTLDLQGTATLSGTYAFSLSGTDGSESLNPMATVGAFTVGNGGSITGVADFNDANFAYPNETLSGSVTLGPSSTPATTLIAETFGTLTFDVYAIDSTHLKFIETDGIEFLSGDAFSQTNATVATGSLAFTLSGDFASEGPTAVGGFMVTDGNGNITTASTEDINEGGNTSAAPVPFSGTYSSTGSGRFTLNLPSGDGFVGGTQYAAYPSSGGSLLLEIDDSGIMVGAAYTPGIVASFAPPQGFALNFTGINLSASESLGQAVEVDDIAEFATATGLTFTGIVDENSAPGGVPTPRQVFDGTFTAPDSNGRGTLGNTTVNGTLVGEVGLSFYTVDGITFPFIEDDTNGQVSTGVMVVQDASDPTPLVAARTHMYVPHSLVRARSTRSLHRKQK